MEWIGCLLLIVAFPGITAVVNDYYNGQQCGQPGNTVHISMDGVARCCLEHRCARGTVGKMCDEKDATTSQCVSCPETHFMPATSKSSDMIPCYKRRQCPSIRGLTIKMNGTLVSDNVCMCDLEEGFWDRKKQKNPKSCWYKECDIGHELTENGCKPCKPGTYKKKKSIEMCTHWTDCSAIGLSYGPNGNTSYDPGCVNDTIRLSTGASTNRDVNNNKRNNRVLYIVAGVMGCVALIAIVIAIIVILFWRKQHSQTTGRPVGPSTGGDGTSTQPYVAMNGVNGIQSDKDSYETIQSPTDHYVYKGLDRQTDKVGEDEASSDSVEEDAQPYDDNCKTPPIPKNSTPISATGTPGKVQPTIININAHNLHMQYGDNNEIGINHSS